MNWTLITLPAPEELAGGYVPSLAFAAPQCGPDPVRPNRTLVALLGLVALLRILAPGHDEPGERRLAELRFAESAPRIIAAQDCPSDSLDC